MYVKIMSGENIPDDDPRKGYRLIEGVEEVDFGRTDLGALSVDMMLYDGCRLVTYPHGNVYVFDVEGNQIDHMGVAPYHPKDGEAERERSMALDQIQELADKFKAAITGEAICAALAGEHGRVDLPVDPQVDGPGAAFDAVVERLVKDGCSPEESCEAGKEWTRTNLALYTHYVDVNALPPYKAFRSVEALRRGQTVAK